MIDQLFPEVVDKHALYRKAIQFATMKGGRSGRTANQFSKHIQGILLTGQWVRLGKSPVFYVKGSLFPVTSKIT